MTTTPSVTQSSNRRLPAEFYQLTDPEAGVQLPPHHRVDLRLLDNRELDKLVSQLGRNKATWRRALLLHEWLVDAGHIPDDRLCTTVSASVRQACGDAFCRTATMTSGSVACWMGCGACSLSC